MFAQTTKKCFIEGLALQKLRSLRNKITLPLTLNKKKQADLWESSFEFWMHTDTIFQTIDNLRSLDL